MNETGSVGHQSDGSMWMMRSRPLEALAGLVAFALCMTLADLFAAILSIVSPRVAVGDAVIRFAPGSAVHFATETFGTNDKPLLLATLVLITLVFGGLVGAVSRRYSSAPTYGFALWWGVVAYAVWTDLTQAPAAAGVTGAAAIVGWAVLRFLLRRIPECSRPTSADRSTVAAGDPRVRTPDRRRFLTFAAATAGASVVSAVGARRLAGRDIDIEDERSSVVLPVARPPLPVIAPSAALDVPGISSLVTPNDDFYRIDTALSVPRVDVQKWRLGIDGMVDRPVEFTYADLAALPTQEVDVTLTCVSNEVGDHLVGNARWLGIPLRALLDRAGVQAGATQIVGRSVDSFTVGFPTDVALDGRASMVVLGMNGEPLPAKHGFPARLLVPGLYGYVSATKWLSKIELTTFEDFDAYWIDRGWAKDGPIKTQSRIDVPSNKKTLSAGRAAIAGVAWGGIRSISRVEVRVLPADADDAPWMNARLGEALSQSTWRQWVVDWDAQPGEYEIAVRATDGEGETQTPERAGTVPSGATGWHTIRVKVRAP